MKTLLFFRHGKSDWDALYDHDHERPLAKRGRRATDAMGQLLVQINQVPNRVVCSTSVRTRTTLERAMQAGGWSCPVEYTDRLYHASANTLLNLVRAEPQTTETLMLVGHEPTCSNTIECFIGGGDVRFPTAAIARVNLHIDVWQTATFGTGQLIWLIPPKLFG